MGVYKGDIYYGAGKTNCLTYVPKNVNLTLTDGALTLKAGSKVYIPNGFETKEVTTEEVYECFLGTNNSYYYAKVPYAEGDYSYTRSDGGLASSSEDLWEDLGEISAINSDGSIDIKYSKEEAFSCTRYTDGDLREVKTEIITTDIPKFDEKIIESDINVGQATHTGTPFVYYIPSTQTCPVYWIDKSVSGASDSFAGQTYHVWYDTGNNIVKAYGSDSVNYQQSSFPLGIITLSSGNATSINQVFDWIGRIGSSVFLFPGVKGLCPYEFNPDGTYKNIEFETDKVEVRTNNRNAVDGILLYQPTVTDKFLFWHEGVYVSYAESNPKTNWTRWYNRKENKWYYLGDDGTELNDLPMCVLATGLNAPSTSPYNITSLTPRAVQTNNTARKIGDVYFCPGKTNCLTSFPKNINWSITDGVLTLKAGSKVYIPNGWTEYTYYKCTTTSWTQPTLSADGTVGGTSYACRCKLSLDGYPAYKAFDSDKTSSIWASSTTSVGNWIEFYSPVELIVSKVSVTNRKENIQGTFGTVTLQGSLNGTDYYDLAVYTNTNSSASATWSFNTSVQRPAKYLRLYANSQLGSNGDIVIANISFTAQQVTATVESTADDYTYVIGSGKRVFDEVVIDGDKTFNNTGGTGIYPMFYDKYNNSIHSAVPTMGSGTATPTASTSYQLFYNVSENIIYFDGGSQLGGYSLPLGRINATDGVPTSISQHFSWFGFIGSTAFTLPNIEGLCSNGFNTDGTYKNVRGYEDEVQIHTYTSNWTRAKQPIFLQNGRIDFTGVNNDGYHEGTDRSAYDSLSYQCFYNTKENKTYYSGSTVGSWSQTYRTLLGYINMTSGVISSITHIGAKTTNDLKRVKETYNGSTFVRGYISNATIFEKSTAGTYTVTIPYNGYYQLWLVGAGGGGMFNSSGNKGSSAAGNSGGYVNVKAYLKKGSYSVTVGAGGTAKGGLDWTGWGNNGGNTSISFGGKTLLLAGGGTANKVSYPSGYQQNSTISVANQINSGNFTLVQTVSNLAGNKGGLGGNGSSPTGGASRYGGYGKGGNVYNRNSADAGGNGYVKVVAI